MWRDGQRAFTVDGAGKPSSYYDFDFQRFWMYEDQSALPVLQNGDGCRLTAKWRGGAPEGRALLEMPSGKNVSRVRVRVRVRV